MNVFTHQTEFPPSLVDKPLLYMLSVMGLLLGTLIAIQWLHRVIAEVISDRMPVSHPMTAYRLVLGLILIGAISRSVPGLILVMCWSSLTPAWREGLAVGTWSVNVIWAGAFATAWWIDRVTHPMLSYQLHRVPAPSVASNLRANKLRGLVIFAIVVVIAFATTFIRVAPPNAESSHLVAGS